jgi:hypothetical protein
MGFERLYTTTDYYDGPRRGIADFGGEPHFYESCWANIDNHDQPDVFLLTPITGDVIALALEDWEIWCRWSAAFRAGLATEETHPALPADRARHDELASLLKQRLVTDMSRAVAATAAFDFSQRDEEGNPIERVAWTPVPFNPSLDQRAKYREED